MNRHMKQRQEALWSAIHDYVIASGGDPAHGAGSLKKCDAVIEIEELAGIRHDEDELERLRKDLDRIRKTFKKAPWRESDDPVVDGLASILGQSISTARNTVRKLAKYWCPEDDP